MQLTPSHQLGFINLFLLRFTDATVMTSCWFRNDTLFTERHKRDLVFHLKHNVKKERGTVMS